MLAEDGKIFGFNERNERKSVEKRLVPLISFYMTFLHTFVRAEIPNIAAATTDF